MPPRRNSTLNTIRKGGLTARRDRRNALEESRGRASDLEVEWQALLEGEKDSLMLQLVREGRQLERAFQQYQSKMENIMLCSKECLESTQHIKLDNKIARYQSSPRSAPDSRTESDSQTADLVVQQILIPTSRCSSIIYQAGRLMNQKLAGSEDVAPNDLCEGIMAWKRKTGQRSGFAFLLNHFHLDEIPSLLNRSMNCPKGYSCN